MPNLKKNVLGLMKDQNLSLLSAKKMCFFYESSSKVYSFESCFCFLRRNTFSLGLTKKDFLSKGLAHKIFFEDVLRSFSSHWCYISYEIYTKSNEDNWTIFVTGIFVNQILNSLMLYEIWTLKCKNRHFFWYLYNKEINIYVLYNLILLINLHRAFLYIFSGWGWQKLGLV